MPRTTAGEHQKPLGPRPRKGKDGHKALAGFQKMIGLSYGFVSDQLGQSSISQGLDLLLNQRI